MAYTVKEMFYTLQGEGAHSGRPAVFCRFAGCNLWSGLEADRSEAVCRFCDTDFIGIDGPGGGRFASAGELAERAASHWPSPSGPTTPFVVCTGGEPLLQLDAALIDAFHQRGFEIAVETNGTLIAPEGIDWLCVSPKAGAGLICKKGDEVKLVFPQVGLDPAAMEGLRFNRFFLQPMDGPDMMRNTQLAVEYCKSHPLWRLSLQTHKILGIP